MASPHCTTALRPDWCGIRLERNACSSSLTNILRKHLGLSSTWLCISVSVSCITAWRGGSSSTKENDSEAKRSRPLHCLRGTTEEAGSGSRNLWISHEMVCGPKLPTSLSEHGISTNDIILEQVEGLVWYPIPIGCMLGDIPSTHQPIVRGHL